MLRAAWLLLCLLPVSLPAADNLEDILKQMDAAAAKFRGLSAGISYTHVTVVVDDKTVETGTIYFQKEKSGKGYKVLIDFTQPAPKTVLVKGNEVRILRPKINQVEVYAIGEKKELMEEFLLLGFGGGGHELAKVYKVTLAPECSLDGAACVKLNLVPQGGMAKNLKAVELWLSPDTWLPLQQKFTESSRDHTTVRYTKVKAEIQPDDRFKLNDKGFKVVKPGQD